MPPTVGQGHTDTHSDTAILLHRASFAIANIKLETITACSYYPHSCQMRGRRGQERGREGRVGEMGGYWRKKRSGKCGNVNGSSEEGNTIW